MYWRLTARTALPAQLAVLLAGVALSAQTPPADVDVARATELLTSSKLEERAWGAYAAGRLKDAGLHALLVQQLRTANPVAPAFASGPVNTYSAAFAYSAALLDALIQEGGTVPADAILRLNRPDGLWRAQMLVLLSRSREPEAEDALLAWREEALLHPLIRLTIEDVLLEMRSTRCFAKIVGEIPITARFDIRDGQPNRMGEGIGGSIATGSAPELPGGSPPAGLYFLHTQPAPDSVLLAHGIRSVYYRRLVPPARDDRPFRDIGRPRSLLEFLAAWNNRSLAEAEQVFTPVTEVQWTGAIALSREVSQRMNAQIARIQSFFDAAKQSGGPNLAGTKLRVIPVLKDERRSEKTPVPEFSPVEFTLK
jgi:hypothetical protein